MAGSGCITLRNGLKVGLKGGNATSGSAGIAADEVELGYGTPTHISPDTTLYIKLDATLGTSSHFRKSRTHPTTWVAMSDA